MKPIISLVTACLLLTACPRAALPTMSPDESLAYETPDGWLVPLGHYAGEGPPVLLVHGMSANHYNWDFDERISLIDELNDAGWDVWVVTLPGDEDAAAESMAPPVTFDALARTHLPAAIAEVQRRTGAEEVYWVGHSLGGMLLYASLAEQPIAAGVAVASPGQFRDTTGLAKLRARGPKGAKAADGMAKMGRRLSWTYHLNPVVGLVGRRKHLDPKLAKGLARHALDGTPPGVTEQVMGWVQADGELLSAAGEPLIDFDAPVPILAMGATRDRAVSHLDVQQTCERLAQCTFVSLEGYGHVDPLLGVTAEVDVYPQILAFLEAHRER